MRRRITVDAYSVSSINDAIKYLEAYQQKIETLPREILRAICDEMIIRLNQNIASLSIPPEYDPQLEVDHYVISDAYGGYVASVFLKGQDVAFIEFGAGISYNTPVGESPHPKGEELGYTIGSWNPDSDNASNPDGWWFAYGGAPIHTFGVKGQAPLYNAYLSVVDRIPSIIRKVARSYLV